MEGWRGGGVHEGSGGVEGWMRRGGGVCEEEWKEVEGWRDA